MASSSIPGGTTLIDFESSPHWRRSRRCDTGHCIEAALVGQEVAVRDSKDPNGPILRFSMDEWSSFVAGVREGDFHFTNT
jgi:uncharacterized protein DUF397